MNREKEAATVVPMSLGEAQSHVQKIKNNVRQIRYLVLELFEREGWKSLGYDSWHQCTEEEFGSSARHVDRLLDAAQTERHLSQVVDNQQNLRPTGPIPERQLRPLVDLDPEEQQRVYTEAVKSAPNGKMTAKHVAQTKKVILHPVSFANKVEADNQNEFCEVGWLLLTTERDMAMFALTPKNKEWQKDALAFFESLRKRKIVTVS